MDWNKVMEMVTNVARRTLTLAISSILILVAVTGTYLAAIGLWWIVKFAQKALGI